MITTNKGILNPVLSTVFNELPDDSRYAGLAVLPPQPVAQKAATVPVDPRENDGLVDDKHANGGAFERITSKADSMSYLCVDRGLEHVVTSEDYEFYSDYFNADITAMMRLRRKMLLAREARVAAIVQDTAEFTGASYLVDNGTSDPWTAAGADIKGHIHDCIDLVKSNSGAKADSIVMSNKLLRLIAMNTAVKGYFPGAPRIGTAMMLQWLLDECELKNVIVADASYNSANEGQAYANSDVWSDLYFNVFKRCDSLANGGFGQTLIWDKMAIGTGDVSIYTYSSDEVDGIVHRSRLFECNKMYDKRYMAMGKVKNA
jgi:hypothetical protein